MLNGFDVIYVLVAFLSGFVFGLAYRFLLKKFAKSSPHGIQRNIGVPDRILRAMIGVGLLVWAIFAGWSPILLFFSGFTFFEAIFSWCGLYAALGKNSCPLN